jgi:nitrate reductase alpha subunit
MLSLSRGGPDDLDESAGRRCKIGVKDNDWIEVQPQRRGGGRAIVSHRMPEGTVYMYHAKDRTVDVPRTETSGLRGGIHNSLTRMMIKPTHIIGGYAQLSFFFNYLGPTQPANNRDAGGDVLIRRRSTRR